LQHNISTLQSQYSYRHVSFACPNIPPSGSLVLKNVKHDSAPKCDDQPQIKQLKQTSDDSSQQSIANYCSPGNISEAVKNEIDCEVLKCFACCNIPFRVSEYLHAICCIDEETQTQLRSAITTRISEKLLRNETAHVICDTQCKVTYILSTVTSKTIS